MIWVTRVSRWLLGLIFFVFGLNGLLMFTTGTGFIPMPKEMPEKMTIIMKGFMETGYLMILVKFLETVAGLLLLIGKYTRLAMVLLTPIIVNILCIHIFAEPSGLPMALVISVLSAVVISQDWQGYRSLLEK